MILIGQYDSPFVRRVAIAMKLYGLAFEHQPWSVFRDGEKIARYNPLMRVPTLVLDDGLALVDSHAILDAVDDMAPPGRALIARSGEARRAALRICALATGLCDKAVSLVYETAVHSRGTPTWVERCTSQIAGVLSELDRARSEAQGPWWAGEAIGHSDIAVGCALRFLTDAHPSLFDLAEGWPALAEHAARCEGLPVFVDTQQAFYVAPLPGGAA